MAKIGIDGRMYRPGATGIGRYIYELVSHLLEIDTENEYYIFLNSNAFNSYESNHPNLTKVETNAGYYSFSEQTTFYQELNKYNLDLVHFTHFNAPLLYSKPYVVTIHDLTLSKFPGQKMNSLIHRAAYNLTIRRVTQKSRHIISVSDYTKKDIIELLNISSDKITTIYEGISKQFLNYKESDKSEKILQDMNIFNDYLLYVGVWRNHKNLLTLIKSFNEIAQKNSSINLVLTGKEDNLHYPEVRNLINSLNIQDRIVCPGFVNEEQLITLYNNAKILINPSFYEGFGFPPLEAMTLNTPAIISDASCHREVCEDSVLYFDPSNFHELTEKINLLLTDNSLREEMLKRGREHIKKYTWQRCAEETLNIYKMFLNKK